MKESGFPSFSLVQKSWSFPFLQKQSLTYDNMTPEAGAGRKNEVHQSTRAGNSWRQAAEKQTRGRCLLNCLEMFAELKKTTLSPGPWGQRTAWNLLKYYRHSQRALCKQELWGQRGKNWQNLVSFYPPALSLPSTSSAGFRF